MAIVQLCKGVKWDNNKLYTCFSIDCQLWITIMFQRIVRKPQRIVTAYCERVDIELLG